MFDTAFFTTFMSAFFFLCSSLVACDLWLSLWYLGFTRIESTRLLYLLCFLFTFPVLVVLGRSWVSRHVVFGERHVACCSNEAVGTQDLGVG